MSKNKQPEFKVGDRFERVGSVKLTLQEKIREQVFRVLSEDGKTPIMTISELSEYEHLRVMPRPAHRPKGSGKKTPTNSPVKSTPEPGETEAKVPGEIEQASTPAVQPPTPEEVSPTPAHTDEVPKNEPEPFDPATFTMKVGPPRVMSVPGRTWTGGTLRETLTNMLKFYGITGSPAELKAKLVLDYPDSPGLKDMLNILKGKEKAGTA